MYVAGITTHDLIDQHPPTAWALPDNLSMLAGFGSSLSIDLFGGIQSVPAAVCFDESSELEQQLAGIEPRIGGKRASLQLSHQDKHAQERRHNMKMFFSENRK